MNRNILSQSKISFLIFIFIFTIFFVSSCSQKEANVIRIGAILPLTGDAAQWGIPPQKGAELVTKLINDKRGKNDKFIELYIEDTNCEPNEGVSAFNKIISSNKKKIVIWGVCSSVTLAVAPIAERKDVLLISPASTNPSISSAGDNIFRVIPSDNLRGKIFAEYIYNDVGINTVALLYINNEGGVGNKNSFLQRFEELGGEIAIKESYEQGTNDVRTQLAKINNSQAKAIVIVSYPNDTVITLKQIKELGIKMELFFQTEAVEDPNVSLNF